MQDYHYRLHKLEAVVDLQEALVIRWTLLQLSRTQPMRETVALVEEWSAVFLIIFQMASLLRNPSSKASYLEVDRRPTSSLRETQWSAKVQITSNIRTTRWCYPIRENVTRNPSGLMKEITIRELSKETLKPVKTNREHTRLLTVDSARISPTRS